MKRLKHFSIPLLGLKDGKHEFEYNLNKDVFDSFDFGEISKGEFEAHVSITRSSSHYELDFIVQGSMLTACDRCTAEIAIPIQTEEHYVIKIGEERKVEDEIIYILQNDHEINVASYLYESICLRVPMVKKIDCEAMNEEQKPCDKNTLTFLGEKNNDEATGSIWDSLKEIKFEN